MTSPITRASIDQLNINCYNAKADYWDRMPFADILPQEILLQHSQSAGTEVLDIGSGTGMLAEFLKQKGFSLLCIDPSEEMVKRTKAKGLHTVQTNLQDFTTDKTFGIVIACLSLIHVSKAEMPTELERIHKWLNPNGIFVLAMIEGRGEGVQEGDSQYPRYFSFYTKEEILDNFATNMYFSPNERFLWSCEDEAENIISPALITLRYIFVMDSISV